MVVTISTLCAGYLHTKYYRRNELFKVAPLVSFLVYTNDIISDVFFTLKLASYAYQTHENRVFFLYLSITSGVFVFIPLVINFVQLHFEISTWTRSTVLKRTGVSKWIKSNVKILYLMAAICGSSFSAVLLCNSYLFGLNIFSMGLPNYHVVNFLSQRFISDIIFEVKLTFQCLLHGELMVITLALVCCEH